MAYDADNVKGIIRLAIQRAYEAGEHTQEPFNEALAVDIAERVFKALFNSWGPAILVATEEKTRDRALSFPIRQLLQTVSTSVIARTLDGYQQASKRYVRYPEWSEYPIFGLVEEVGELAHIFALRSREAIGYRHGDDQFKKKVRDAIGDILWNLARLSDRIGTNLSDSAAENLIKLEQRLVDGALLEEKR